MVTPAARRKVVQDWVERDLVSERCGSRLMNVSRSIVRYQKVEKNDDALRARLKELAERYPRYGYPTLHAMLHHEGLVKNRKRTYRLYTEEKLQVRTKKRKWQMAKPIFRLVTFRDQISQHISFR